jgi:hypothetical protein
MTAAVVDALLKFLAGLRPAEWVGIAGFFLAASNFVFTQRRAKREPRRQEILAVIAKLRAICEEATDEIVRHLCFQKARKPKEEIYRILSLAQRELAALQSRLPSEKEALLAGFTEWYIVATGDGFPMDKKANAFKTSDERVQGLIRAQTRFLGRLDELRLRCLCDSVKYWHKI